MRRADFLLAGAALAIAVLSFALVRGLRRIVSADSRPAAALDSVPLAPALARPEPELEEPDTPTLAATSPASAAAPASVADEPAPLQGIVWGHLLDGEGRSLRHARLVFRNGSGEQHQVEPDAGGAYSIAGLEPGPWWAAAGSTGHRPDEQSLEIARAAPPQRRDFVLKECARVDVKVLAPDGRPFFEAAKEAGIATFGYLVPVATREPPGERFYGVVGSLNNSFGVGEFWQNGSADVALPQGFLGSVFLEVAPPVHLSLVLRHAVLETRLVETTPAVVTFTLDPGAIESKLCTLRMRVVDADGDPVQGAKMYLTDFGRYPDSESDAGGELDYHSLPPGRGELRVMAKGLAVLRTEIELEPGRTLDLGEVVLGPEVLVSGTVSGPDGEPLEAEFTIGSLADDGTLDLDRSWSPRSEATGRFELLGISAGRHVVQVSVQHGSPRYLPNAELVSANVIVDTRAGPVRDLDLRLPRPSRVSVRWASGARKDLRLRFLDEHGLPRQWGSFYQAAPQSYTLPPGRWKVEVVDSEKRVVAEQSLVLGEAPLELVLGEGQRQ